eukprot:scaffold62241_cov31-Phaeocystis_antarctica.AAC.1
MRRVRSEPELWLLHYVRREGSSGVSATTWDSSLTCAAGAWAGTACCMLPPDLGGVRSKGAMCVIHACMAHTTHRGVRNFLGRLGRLLRIGDPHDSPGSLELPPLRR